MAKYDSGDRVELHPSVAGRYAEYEGRIGVVLDIGGGELNRIAWGLSFTVIGLIVVTGPMFVFFMGRKE